MNIPEAEPGVRQRLNGNYSEYHKMFLKCESFEAGTVLLKQGEVPSFAGLLHTGVVKLSITDENGDELILGLRSGGSWLNSALAVFNYPSPYSITALRDCSMSRISVADFRSRFLCDQAALTDIFFSQCRELISLHLQCARKAGTGNSA